MPKSKAPLHHAAPHCVLVDDLRGKRLARKALDHKPRQAPHGRRRHRRHAQGVRALGRSRHRFAHKALVAQQLACPIHGNTADVVQHDAPALALEQRAAEFRLEPLDGAAERRLRYMQLLGRGGHGA